MFGAMIRAAERWRAVKVTEFERRQMAAVRQDLDQEYQARTGFKAKPSSEDSQTKIPLPGLDLPPMGILLRSAAVVAK